MRGTGLALQSVQGDFKYTDNFLTISVMESRQSFCYWELLGIDFEFDFHRKYSVIGPFATTMEMPLRMCWAMHCGIEEAQTNHTTCFSGPGAHHNELTMV